MPAWVFLWIQFGRCASAGLSTAPERSELTEGNLSLVPRKRISAAISNADAAAPLDTLRFGHALWALDFWTRCALEVRHGCALRFSDCQKLDHTSIKNSDNPKRSVSKAKRVPSKARPKQSVSKGEAVSKAKRVQSKACPKIQSAARLLPTHFHNLQIPNLITINHKSQHRSYLMKATDSCGARIHVQQIEFFVKHHFQNMRMSANK